jgi:YihY family inner membrane protein
MAKRFQLGRALLDFVQGDSMTYAAAIAYYTLFSFFPLVLILLSIGSLFVQRYDLDSAVIQSLSFYLPVGTGFIEKNLRTVMASAGKFSVVGILLLLWTATGAFIPLEQALNRAWGVKRGRGFLHTRITAALMAFFCGCFVLTSVFIASMLGRFQIFLRGITAHRLELGELNHWIISTTEIIFDVLSVLASFLLTVFIFALIYKIVPYTRIRFGQVSHAAMYAGVTWELAKYAFTFWLRSHNYRNVYGSIATIIIILSWVYLSAGILLFFAKYSAQIQGRRS